jgi:hypothetical protein
LRLERSINLQAGAAGSVAVLNCRMVSAMHILHHCQESVLLGKSFKAGNHDTITLRYEGILYLKKLLACDYAV